MSKIRSFFRALIVGIYLSGSILFLVLRALIMGDDMRWPIKRRQQIARRILQILNIKLSVKGTIPEGIFVFISNHKSYMDPVLAATKAPFVPVAKAEVADYPILGAGIKKTGIMWVKRESKDSRKATRVAMAETLDRGFPILVYPEGTTHNAETTKEFKIGTFKIAMDKNIPILPIAVDYKNPDMAWVNDDKLIPHLLKTIGDKVNYAKVSFGKPITGVSPEDLLKKTQAWIDNELLLMRQDWAKE